MSHESNNTMNDEPKINDLLESFRPEVDDLAEETWDKLRVPLAEDAAVQQQAESILRRDRVLRSAMHDVPVPTDLAARLLASLPASSVDEMVSAAPPAEGETVSLPSPPPKLKHLGRRAWMTMLIGGSLAIAAIVLVLGRRGPQDSGNFSEEDLARMVGEWENDPALIASGSWQKLPPNHMLPTHPLEASDLAAPVRQSIGPVWHNGVSIVVYQLVSASGTARLYVVHTGSTFDVPRTPQRALRGLTAGRNAIAWQRGEYLYVMVVDRDTLFRDFVRVREQA